MAPAAGTVGDCFNSTLPLLCMNPLAGKLLLLSAALRMYQHAAGVPLPSAGNCLHLQMHYRLADLCFLAVRQSDLFVGPSALIPFPTCLAVTGCKPGTCSLYVASLASVLFEKGLDLCRW